MKTSSARVNPDPPSAQTARGYAATNLALPGFGSLMARRSVGYAQAALTVAGFGLTFWFGVRFAIWSFQNWAVIYGPEADPIHAMIDMWLRVRWAFLGMALFGFSWLWALTTNAAILRSARTDATPEKPPVLENSGGR